MQLIYKTKNDLSRVGNCEICDMNSLLFYNAQNDKKSGKNVFKTSKNYRFFYKMKEILTSTTFYLEKNITDSFNLEPYHSKDGKGNSHYLHLPYLETCHEIRQNT